MVNQAQLNQALINDAIDKHAAGDLQGAERLCKKVLETQPNHFAPWRILGVIAQQCGKHSLATELISKAIHLNPTEYGGYIDLACAWKSQAQFDPEALDKAIEIYHMAFKMKPDKALPLIFIAGTLADHGREDEAIEVAKLAAEIEPKNSDCWGSLGYAYKNRGLIDEAIEAFKKSIDCNKKAAQSYFNLASIYKFSDSNPESMRILKKMCLVLKQESLGRSSEMHLHYALGKAYEDTKQYKKAFQHYKKANQLKRKSIIYQQKDSPEKLKEVCESWRSENLKIKSPDINFSDYPTPIFIVGMPRSGSSLIEQILATHSEVEGGGELYHFQQSLNIDTSNNKEQAVAAYFKELEKLSEEEKSRIATQYLEHLKSISNGKKYVTDKLPGNYWYLGLIKILLPYAKIIYSKRDPIDTCLSCYKQDFATGHHYSYDLEELAENYNFVEGLIKFWIQEIPESIYIQSYEDLTANQENQTKKLLEFCGLDWQDQCLEFHKNDRAVSTASAIQVRKPIYKSSVAKWKHYEQELQPLIQKLNLDG